MKELALSWLLKIIKTETIKTLIAMGLNKLLASTNDGVTKEISIIMIEAIAKSRANPTSQEAFEIALKELKGE